jgi:hypothetical protein
MTNQNSLEEAPQTDPVQMNKRVIPRTTLICALVVLAAIAVIIILAMR